MGRYSFLLQPVLQGVCVCPLQAAVLGRRVRADVVLPLQLLQDVAQLPQGLKGLLWLLDGEFGRVVLVPLRTLVDCQGGTGIWVVVGHGGQRQGQSDSLTLPLSLCRSLSILNLSQLFSPSFSVSQSLSRPFSKGASHFLILSQCFFLSQSIYF